MKIKTLIISIFIGCMIGCSSNTKQNLIQKDISYMLKDRPLMVEGKKWKIHYKQKEGEKLLDCVVESKVNENAFHAKWLTIGKHETINAHHVNIGLGNYIKKENP